MLRKTLFSLLLTFVLLLFWVLAKTILFSPTEVTLTSPQQDKYIHIDSIQSLHNLREAISFATISHKPAMRDEQAFSKMIAFLDSAYPKIHAFSDVRTINQYSKMYRLYGTDPAAKPIILMAHIDVVPVDGGDWDFPPFSGEIHEGYIYGRGTLDDKGSAIAIMEALEHMLKSGWQPSRTIIVCLGHDEEIGGEEGAKKMAEMLMEEGIKAHMVLDEGGVIAKGLVPGFDRPVGLIGTSEKGYLNLELRTNIEGGHSSMPEKETSIDVLAKAIAKIAETGFPSEFTAPIIGFMDHLGPHLPFFERMAFANRILFSPIIKKIYEKNAPSRALIQTTVVPTIFRAGIKDNVIPQQAKIIINLRLLPGWDAERCIAYLEKIIDDDRVKILHNDDFSYTLASSPSPTDNDVYRKLAKTVREHFGDVLPVPYLVLGATDARHFQDLSENIYRFMPFRLGANDVQRIHGTNERLAISSFYEGIYFYQRIISDFCDSY